MDFLGSDLTATTADSWRIANLSSSWVGAMIGSMRSSISGVGGVGGSVKENSKSKLKSDY